VRSRAVDLLELAQLSEQAQDKVEPLPGGDEGDAGVRLRTRLVREVGAARRGGVAPPSNVCSVVFSTRSGAHVP